MKFEQNTEALRKDREKPSSCLTHSNNIILPIFVIYFYNTSIYCGDKKSTLLLVILLVKCSKLLFSTYKSSIAVIATKSPQ